MVLMLYLLRCLIQQFYISVEDIIFSKNNKKWDLGKSKSATERSFYFHSLAYQTIVEYRTARYCVGHCSFSSRELKV